MNDLFLDDELAGLHDAVFDACGKSLNYEELVQFWRNLPRDIQDLAEEWGFNDTEFGNKVFQWVKTHGT